MTWLDELKEGSAVIVPDVSNEDHRKSIGKVLRTTATKVFLESGQVYSRKNGLISPRIEWGKRKIQEATPEAVQRINEAKRKYDLEGQLLRLFANRKNIQKLSASQMERIVEVFNEE